jgi:hypothetical protein
LERARDVRTGYNLFTMPPESALLPQAKFRRRRAGDEGKIKLDNLKKPSNIYQYVHYFYK